MTSQQRFRNVTWTLNNPTEEDDYILSELPSHCQYVIYALEQGESGTPHYQGYTQFKSQLRFPAVKKLLGPRVSFYASQGTAAENIAYCRKGSQPKDEWESYKENGEHYGMDLELLMEEGTPKNPGKRSDLDSVAETISTGASIREVAEAHPGTYMRYYKGIERYRHLMIAPRDRKTPKQILCHYGDAGSGKTRKAYETIEANYPGQAVYRHNSGCGFKWFPDYEGNKEIIFEEFRGQCTFSYLLDLTDRYPMKVEVKNGHVEFVADVIHILSPVHPALWYPNLSANDGKMQQLKRRIDKIYHHTTYDDPAEDVTDQDWPVLNIEPSQFSQF